ncbi:cadmium resistance transporter [Methanobacterium sp. ACI-7]|uniref:cadmium resistance transporter n=1 Tax=unclassified Methanobacterium TaxID=2627676 RepID=UPI0039C2CE85
MIDIIFILGAILAFSATNIDDLFILTFFFSNKNFKASHVIMGQYLGIFSLVLISSIGYFFKFIIPTSLLSLLGLIPIIIGIKELLKLKTSKEISEEYEEIEFKKFTVFKVALVTISNGGDNIGIYIPLFATISSYELLLVILIFSLMVTLWCFISRSLVNHRFLSRNIEKYGYLMFPFVLIGIGIHILIG